MKTVAIEWRRLVKDGATGERCGDTGATLRPQVARLDLECRPRGVAIVLKEVALDVKRIAESNQIRIDGELLEQFSDAFPDVLTRGVARNVA